MAIAHDATSTDFLGSSHSSRTKAHTCSGSDRVLFVATTARQSAGQTVTGVTYNGVALTKVDGVNQGTNTIRHELWYLIAPATGANNVVVTWSASVAAASYVINSYTGVHQTTALGTHAATSGLSTSPSTSVSSAADELVVDALGHRENSTATKDASQTLRGSISSGSGSSFTETNCSEEAGAASVTMSWALGTSVSWGLIAVPVKPASSGVTESVPAGGALADGTSPTVRATGSTGGATGDGGAVTVAVSATTGGAITDGTVPGSTASAGTGGALADGITLTASVLATVGGAIADGFSIASGFVRSVLFGTVTALTTSEAYPVRAFTVAERSTTALAATSPTSSLVAEERSTALTADRATTGIDLPAERTTGLAAVERVTAIT